MAYNKLIFACVSFFLTSCNQVQKPYTISYLNNVVSIKGDSAPELTISKDSKNNYIYYLSKNHVNIILTLDSMGNEVTLRKAGDTLNYKTFEFDSNLMQKSLLWVSHGKKAVKNLYDNSLLVYGTNRLFDSGEIKKPLILMDSIGHMLTYYSENFPLIFTKFIFADETNRAKRQEIDLSNTVSFYFGKHVQDTMWVEYHDGYKGRIMNKGIWTKQGFNWVSN